MLLYLKKNILSMDEQMSSKHDQNDNYAHGHHNFHTWYRKR